MVRSNELFGTRSWSNSVKRRSSNDHARFGERAYRCVKPYSEHKSNTGKLDPQLSQTAKSVVFMFRKKYQYPVFNRYQRKSFCDSTYTARKIIRCQTQAFRRRRNQN
ncbi:hypothetical protein TNCV_4230901 [Trichonephila clavipes]|uniref:Uncharacterized protein n=1 Tax=Trichonephila clavipes TaxID=2585209 RepID=A0A8X6SEA4_TRICX|nr:hypothetical protein TNCV_4230901 [Trichonephila clavipes]